MDPASRARLRRLLATVNIAAIALGVPAILYHYIFQMPPSQAPGSRTVLVVLLGGVWLALTVRPLATPSGRSWPFPVRATVMVGGNLLMALLMFLLHQRS